MNNPPKLVSLDQFRRKPVESESPVGDAIVDIVPAPITPFDDGGLSPTHPRTQRRLDAALAAIDKLKSAELEVIAAAVDTKNHRIAFSASSVAREAVIGRTQLYKGDPRIQEAVEAARAEIELALKEKSAIKRPKSKRALEQRITSLDSDHEAAISRLASQKMSDLIRRMGPVLDASQRSGNVETESLTRIRHLERQLEAQVAANQILMGGTLKSS